MSDLERLMKLVSENKDYVYSKTEGCTPFD